MDYQIRLVGVLTLLALGATVAFLVVRAALTIRQGKQVVGALSMVYKLSQELEATRAELLRVQQDLERQNQNVKNLFMWSDRTDKVVEEIKKVLLLK
jgi:hypothetical protein